MSEIVAKRYARALLEIALDQNTVEAFEQQIVLLNETVQSHQGLRKVLFHPQVSPESKKKLIEDIFKDDLKQEVLNLVKILIDNHREYIIADLKDEYVKLADAELGILDITVTTAEPMTDVETTQVKEKLSQAFHKTLRIHTKVDPEIIGGLLVRAGNRLYDGTLAGKLQRFQQALKVGK